MDDQAPKAGKFGDVLAHPPAQARQAWRAFVLSYPERAGTIRLAVDLLEGFHATDDYLKEITWLELDLDQLFNGGPNYELPDFFEIVADALGAPLECRELVSRRVVGIYMGELPRDEALGDLILTLALEGHRPPAVYAYGADTEDDE